MLDYCRRSANPVGRLVLRIAGYRDDALDRSSDALCTALQLTNFWQDFGRDWRAGASTFRATFRQRAARARHDLARGADRRRGRVRSRSASRRRASSSIAGRDVCDGVRGRLRFELRLTWLGGVRILERVEQRPRRICSISGRRSARADVPHCSGARHAWRSAAA